MSLESSEAINVPLAEQKLAAEIERLRRENRQLAKPKRFTIASIVAVAGLIVSVGANIQQYSNALRTQAHAHAELDLAREKWEVERQELEAKIASLREGAEERSGVRQELEKVAHDIRVWDASILEGTVQMNLELAQADGASDPRLAAIYREQAELTKLNIDEKTRRRATLIARQAELEQRLGF